MKNAGKEVMATSLGGVCFKAKATIRGYQICVLDLRDNIIVSASNLLRVDTI